MVLLTAAGSLDSFVQFITVLLLFVFVLAITYVVTKWTSGIQKSQMTGKNIDIIETVRITGNKYIQIVKTGDRYLVIAVCKDTVTMLTELSEESLTLGTEKEVNGLSFNEILEKIKLPKANEKDK